MPNELVPQYLIPWEPRKQRSCCSGFLLFLYNTNLLCETFDKALCDVDVKCLEIKGKIDILSSRGSQSIKY